MPQLVAPRSTPLAPPPPAPRPTRAAPAGGSRVARWLAPALSLVLFFLALHVLRGELHEYGYREISRTVRAIPARMLLEALAFTVLSYLVLPGYDALGLAYAGRTGGQRIPAHRIWLGAATAYGLSQTLGVPAFTGSAVRYRFWSAWGLSSAEIARAVAFAGATFTIGVLLVSGTALVLEPAATLARTHLPPVAARAIGAALLGALGAYVAWSVVRGGRPLRPTARLARRFPAIASYELPVPRARLALAQLAVGALDWCIAAAALWSLLPDDASIRFLPFVGIFVLAQFAGQASHVPGGLGVFETLMVLLLGPHVATRSAFAAIVAFRAIYYLLPFGVAVVTFSLVELREHHERLLAVARTGIVARVAPAVVPLVMSAATFAAGALLLWSGATPSVHGRLETLDRLLPLGVIEASHLLGSLAGTALLVLAWALRHRIGAAWGLTVALLAGGIAASLLKGLDWEEALVLAMVLAILLPFRRAFYRRSALTAEPLEPEWILAIVAVVGASVWLGFFSYRHVEYSTDLWWHIGRHADAPRFLRASITSAGALALFGFARLMRHAPVETEAPDDAALDRAARIASSCTDTGAYRALLGDKSLLFAGGASEIDETVPDADVSPVEGFVQYAVAGRSWVALGEPVVGSCDEASSRHAARTRAELAWQFKELAAEHGGWPVFYEVGADSLPVYIDLGLGFLKLGEAARVDLRTFSLEGGGRKGLRRVLKDAERAGAAFDVIPVERVPDVLPALRRVSDEWLAHKHVREKGFSLGFFDEAYLRRFPVAVVTVPSLDARERDVVAFANLWPGGGRDELSVDLMRFAERAPRSAMDYLFTQLMLWGQREGYRWFDLGMAPLAGLESRQLAPLWARAGAWLFRHGEHFYNYQGVRQYKEKFDPVWEPRYLASPGGLALPRILANVAALISGGITGIVRK